MDRARTTPDIMVALGNLSRKGSSFPTPFCSTTMVVLFSSTTGSSGIMAPCGSTALCVQTT